MTKNDMPARDAARRTWIKPKVRLIAAGAAQNNTRMRMEGDSAFSYS